MKKVYQERLLSLFQEGFDRKIYSAGALAVGLKGEVLFKEAKGFVSYQEGAAAVHEHTLFDMASITKILSTTMTAFQLIQEGRLRLQDSLSYFFEDVPADKREITVFHLMTHTSGIPAEIHLWKTCTRPDDAVSVILQTPLVCQTGTETIYSCMGYILLGKICEKICHADLYDLSKHYVFDPLGMKDTSYRPLSRFGELKTAAYTETQSLNGPTPPGIVHDENARFLDGISGNAGVFSSLHDMIRFCSCLSQGGKGYLSRELMDAALINYTRGQDDNRGLGFQLSGPAPSFFGDLFGERGFGHTGFTGTSIAIDKETGLFVVYLTNRVHPTRENGLLTRHRHLIHNAAVSAFSPL